MVCHIRLGHSQSQAFRSRPICRSFLCRRLQALTVADTFSEFRNKFMAMNCIRSLKSNFTANGAVGFVARRTFSAGGKSKKGGKGGGAGDTPKASSLSKEVKSTTVVGANILKDGTDPKIMADSEYAGWLWHLLDKRPALSELKRKKIETIPYEDLRRFVKLDNRVRIKENNAVKAKK